MVVEQVDEERAGQMDEMATSMADVLKEGIPSNTATEGVKGDLLLREGESQERWRRNEGGVIEASREEGVAVEEERQAGRTEVGLEEGSDGLSSRETLDGEEGVVTGEKQVAHEEIASDREGRAVVVRRVAGSEEDSRRLEEAGVVEEAGVRDNSPG